MSVDDEISSNSDILRYISGGMEDDVTEDSFIVVDRQTENDERSPDEQETREKLKLEQMMTSMKLSVSSESGSSSGSKSTEPPSQRLEVPEMEPSSIMNSVVNDESLEEIERLKKENQVLKDTLNTQNRKLREWNETIQLAQSESTMTINQLREENETLKTLIQEKDKQIEEFSAGLVAAQIRKNSEEFVAVETTGSQLAETKKELEETRKRNAELDELYQLEIMQNTELKEKLRASEQSSRPSEEERMASNDEFITLKTVVNSLEFEMQMQEQKLGERDNSLEEANKLLKIKDDEIAVLRNSMTVLDGKMCQLRTDATAKFMELSKRNEEGEHALQDMALAKQRCEELCQQYADRLNEMSAEIQQCRNNGDESSQNDLRRLRQQYAVLDKENTELRTQIAALSTENDSIGHWKEQCQVFQADYQQVVAQKDQLNTRNLELNQEVENLQEALEKKEKELHDLHNVHTRLTQEHLNRIDGNYESDEAPDSFKSVVGSVFETVTNTVGNFILPKLRNEDRQQEPNNAPEGAAAASAPEDPHGSANYVPPCPICSRQFASIPELVEHSARCGESPNNSGYGSQLDPFVFLPNQ